MQKRILCYAVACLLSLNVFSQYIHEGNQDLVGAVKVIYTRKTKTKGQCRKEFYATQ